MIKSAKKSVTLVTTEEGLIAKNKHFGNLLKKAHDKGVKIKILAPFGAKAKETIAEMKKN